MSRSHAHALPIAIAALLASNAAAQLTVAAAAELRPALEEVRRVYTERTGNPLRTVYAPPAGVLDKAIKGGIDMILVPNVWIDSAQTHKLSSQLPGFVVNAPVAAWSRQGCPLPDAQLLYLQDTTIHGIAVSDPAQSPDGARVRPFIEALTADSSFLKRLVVSADPSSAIDTIMAGKADAAILPQSAFWSSPVGGMGRQILLDTTLVAPQRTMSLILNVAPERQDNARAFLAWALGPQGKGIWRRNGFLP